MFRKIGTVYQKISDTRMKWGQYICWYNVKAPGSIPNYSLDWNTANTSLPVPGRGSTRCCWLACSVPPFPLLWTPPFDDTSKPFLHWGVKYKFLLSGCLPAFTGIAEFIIFWETPDKDVCSTFGINLPAGSKVYWDHVLACREHGHKILTSGGAGWKLKNRLSSY